uniref:Uncharacterized protein n=1 Tax=Rangifer tarandus platyrhynchus TaxID=3082113 RepID=A0ACB0EQ34_RANTA|nr:unnamed protein product [Rangifer tarandus platyrhynchus]
MLTRPASAARAWVVAADARPRPTRREPAARGRLLRGGTCGGRSGHPPDQELTAPGPGPAQDCGSASALQTSRAGRARGVSGFPPPRLKGVPDRPTFPTPGQRSDSPLLRSL